MEGPASAWNLVSTYGIDFYRSAPGPFVRLVVFTRRGGASKSPYESLNVSCEVGDSPESVAENLSRVANAIGTAPVVTLRQVHSATVVPVAYNRIPPDVLDGDALHTSLPGIGLGIKVADCLPVFVYSLDGRCSGVAHCGWKGTGLRVAEQLARAMSRRHEIPLIELRFSLGPCICADCYKVKSDVRDTLAREFPVAERFFTEAPGYKRPTWHLDLRAANRWLLSEMGLSEDPGLEECTRENPDSFYSVRGKRTTGRNLAAIIIDR